MADTVTAEKSNMLPLIIGGGLVFAIIVYFVFIKKPAQPVMTQPTPPGAMPPATGPAALVGAAASGALQTAGAIAQLVGK